MADAIPIGVSCQPRQRVYPGPGAKVGNAPRTWRGLARLFSISRRLQLWHNESMTTAKTGPVDAGSPTPDAAMTRPKSAALFARARQVIPGGVNSPVRAFTSVGGDAPCSSPRANGYWLTCMTSTATATSTYVCSWGPMILGHAHPEPWSPPITEAAAARHESFGAPDAQREVRAGR